VRLSQIRVPIWANYESSTAATTSGLVSLRRSLASLVLRWCRALRDRGCVVPCPGRGKRGKDRIKVLDDILLSTDHQAVAAFQPRDTAAGARGSRPRDDRQGDR